MHRWKLSLQLGTFKGDAKGSTSPTTNSDLFADLLLFVIGEGDEATLLSFTTCCAPIDAFNALLEPLNATWNK